MRIAPARLRGERDMCKGLEYDIFDALVERMLRRAEPRGATTKRYPEAHPRKPDTDTTAS